MSLPIACPVCRAQIVPSAAQLQSLRVSCAACKSEFNLRPTALVSVPATLTFESLPPALEHTDAVSETLSLMAGKTADFVRVAKEKPKSLPDRVGRFEIRRELGEGAFGKVYEAFDAQLDRLVALKVAKLDRGDVEQKVKRFLREAKSAAGLRHPHIVPLYEFGKEGDLFYLVSAFIAGQTMQARLAGQAAGQPKLNLRQGSELVRRLAEALNYAHQQGIVHRDVKPGNVMLDEKDDPILLDFGLASRQEEAEQLTHDGQVLGTPLYMAPEQAKGKDGKTIPESDQYALGVILYELISGTTPFRGTPELVMFQHMEAELPSPRLKNSAVPRDLETICLKSLAKDPAQRYASCQALADDLRRWLEGEPITARRASLAERTLRWGRKNPLSAILMGAVAASLTLGVVVSTAFALQSNANAQQARLNEQAAQNNALKEKMAAAKARAAEGQARAAETKANESATLAQTLAVKEKAAAAMEQRARQQAERVGLYLRDLFAANDPQGLGLLGLRSLQEQGQTLTARELLDRGARQIETQLDDEPLTRAALMDMIGEVYRTLGLYDEAQPLLEQSLEIRRAGLPPYHPDLAESLTHFGSWNLDKGFFVKADELYQEAFAIREEQGEAAELAASELLLRWALAKTFLEREEAAELAKRALDIRVKHHGPDHRDVAVAKAVWSAVLIDSGKILEAAGPSLEAVGFLLKEGGGDKDQGLKATTEFQKAMVFSTLNQHYLAEMSFRASVRNFQALLGKDHIYSAIPLFELGSSLEQQGKLDEAELAWRECLAIIRTTTGLEHPRASRLIERLTDLYGKKKQSAEGLTLWKETIAAQEARYGKDYPWRSTTLMKYAKFEAKWGDVPTAEPVAREVMAIVKATPTKLSRNNVISLQNLAVALGDEGDLDLVREIYRFVVDWEQKHAAKASSVDCFATLSNLADILVCRGHIDEAEPHLLAANELLKHKKLFGTTSSEVPLVSFNLGRVAWAKGDFAKAEEIFRQTVRQAVNTTTENKAAGGLVTLLTQQEEHASALEALPLLVKGSGTNPIDTAAFGHVEALLHSLNCNQHLAEKALQRTLAKLKGTSNPEALAYVTRTRLALAAPADMKTAREALIIADTILASNPKSFAAWHIKAQSQLRLGQGSEALDALTAMGPDLAQTFAEVRSLLTAQAGLLDESNSDRERQFKEALARAIAFSGAARENKNPLLRRFEIWYWLDLRCLIANSTKFNIK